MEKQIAETFGEELADMNKEPFYMVNFLRPDILDEDGGLEEVAPKVYEPGGNLEEVRPVVIAFLEKYNVSSLPRRWTSCSLTTP